jgi:TRAP-type uncharacterized transport system fused permease subunit
MDLPTLAARLFIFYYFGCISNVTPPGEMVDGGKWLAARGRE